MKKILIMAIILMSASAFPQDEQQNIEDGQKKKLMIKQIQIIKSIKSQLNKLLK